MTNVQVLLTCIGGDLSAEIIKAFKASNRYNVKIIGVDNRDECVGRHFVDVFEAVPMGDAEDYIDSMIAICKKYKPDLIIPGSDGEAITLSASRKIFADMGCQIASPSIEVLRTLNDKAKTYKKISDASIEHAKYFEVNDLDALEKSMESLYEQFGEFVIKPALSRGGRDVFVIRSDMDIEESYYGGREAHLPFDLFKTKYLKTIGEHFPVVVMERLFEPVYDVDVLSWDGVAKQVVPRLRHNPAGIPFTGNTLKNDKVLIDLAEQLSEIFNLSWLLDVDVMTRRDGNPVVLEINPRMSGSLISSVVHGIPLMDQIIALSRGEPIDRVDVPDNAKTMAYNAVMKVEE